MKPIPARPDRATLLLLAVVSVLLVAVLATKLWPAPTMHCEATGKTVPMTPAFISACRWRPLSPTFAPAF